MLTVSHMLSLTDVILQNSLSSGADHCLTQFSTEWWLLRVDCWPSEVWTSGHRRLLICRVYEEMDCNRRQCGV